MAARVVRTICHHDWVFPKIMVPPNHPFGHRVFHYFHHPFWGVYHPYFWFNIHICRDGRIHNNPRHVIDDTTPSSSSSQTHFRDGDMTTFIKLYGIIFVSPMTWLDVSSFADPKVETEEVLPDRSDPFQMGATWHEKLGLFTDP